MHKPQPLRDVELVQAVGNNKALSVCHSQPIFDSALFHLDQQLLRALSQRYMNMSPARMMGRLA